MCRIETSIHECGHASVPIHEFCPRNPSRLLPNERGACARGYERTVPLLPHICVACKKILEGRGTFAGDGEACAVEGAQEDGRRRRDSARGGAKDEGTQTAGAGTVGRRVVLREPGGEGCLGAVVLPEGVEGIEIAWG